MQITFIIKGKNLKFFIRTGNLRTRGNSEHSGLAHRPMALQVCCAPAARAHRRAPGLTCGPRVSPPSAAVESSWEPEVGSTVPPPASLLARTLTPELSVAGERKRARPSSPNLTTKQQSSGLKRLRNGGSQNILCEMSKELTCQ